MNDKFSLTIGEEDTSECGDFLDTGNCLIATALKRKGFKEVKVFGSQLGIVVDGREYDYSNKEQGRLSF